MLTLLLLVPTAAAAFWPSTGRSTPSRNTRSAELLQLDALQDLTAAERSRIFSSGEGKAVETGLPSTDCFRSAAARLDCEFLEIDEATRVQAAIGFTLCELSTARAHAPPLECRPFKKAGTSVSQQEQYTCVEALARSPQHWASYSGYLQRVSLHCLAFRAGSDIDTAKAIYTNATYEKVALLQHLQRRERGMELNVSQLRDLLTTFDKISNTLRAQVVHAEEGVAAARVASESIVQDTSIAVYDLVRRLNEALLAGSLVAQDQLSQGLKRIAEDQAVRLSSIVSTIEGDLQAGVELLLNSLATERQAVGTSLDRISLRSAALDSIMQDAVSAVGSLIPISARLADDLAAHLATVQLSNLHVQSTETRLDQLAHSITDLVESTVAQMRSINDTAATIRDDMRAAVSYRQPDLELWHSIVERLVRWILTSPYGAHLGSAFSSAYVQTIWLVLRGAWSLLCSSATALIILFATAFKNTAPQVQVAPVTPQRRRSRIYPVALRNDVNYGWEDADERARTPTRPRPRTRILSTTTPQS